MTVARFTDDNELTVYFLGAGASIPEGAPSSDDLLERALREGGRSNERIADLRTFLRNVFPDSAGGGLPKAVPTFEEVLTLVDLALKRGEALSPVFGFDGLQKVRENLLYALCWILDRSLRGPRGQLHQRLLNEILSARRLDGISTAFVTTNYDILLDNSLLDMYDKGVDIDYGISFRNTGKGWQAPREKRGIKILKLHGSLNWLFCNTCNSVKVTPNEKGVMRIYTDFELCERDRSKQSPIIIPPSHQKVTENAYLSQIWLEADQALRNASRVVFIGYSLSEADSHVRYLLKRGIHGRRTYPKVMVVSKAAEKGPSTTLDRYRRMFGRVEWKPIGFEGFVEDFTELMTSSR